MNLQKIPFHVKETMIKNVKLYTTSSHDVAAVALLYVRLLHFVSTQSSRICIQLMHEYKILI